MSKRDKIIEAAVLLFAEKGYQKTSMQEIADVLDISKGSLYFYFESKEDLMISIYEHYQQNIFTRAYTVALDGVITEERLVQQFTIQFEGMYENKAYMKMHMQGEGATNSEKLKSLGHRMRGRFFTWLEYNLDKMYGDKIQGYKWDLMWMMQSIYTSYMMLYVTEMAPLHPKQIANHLARQLTTLANAYFRGESESVLQEKDMTRFIVKMDQDPLFASFAQKERAWQELQKKIASSDVVDKSSYEECIYRISEEYQKPHPERIVLMGLFSYIKQERLWHREAKNLEAVVLVKPTTHFGKGDGNESNS
ncbi:TetR/AcrR family transcriptional regulator [Bacillus sp. 2205SS5-2]|uniref:TetR/AcrR family transcriptional regulator n=1 Tax=Bacillus sp. 2205SS5-2 TaxID=3109031 RepID=UPI0030074C36